MIKGKKGGSSSSRTPVESPDSLVSTAYAKILMAISEGETYGSIEYSDIYLDGTPCANPDGTKNFDIEFDYRNGTQDQTYIQGMPETANEITLGTEIASDKPWLHTVTDSTLSAIRVRLEWPSLLQQNGDNGDIYGYRINYLIEISTDGGAYQTYLSTAVDGKTTSGYERSHRIDLPKDGNQWTIRVKRTTVNSTSAKISDKMKIASYTEIIDAKLTYPLTSLLFIKFDASKFNGSIPKIGVLKHGKEIRVPSNYDAFTRKYSGIWDGTFKWSWSNNPAWVMYDLIINDRYGLGDRIKAENLDRYEFYSIAQYCDELVPDGRGGEECRYTCNVYIQNREDAFAVLRDFAAMFRGMTYWYNNKLVVIADMPRDIDYVYTRANIINGEITYSSSSSKARYTSALVSYSDPDNQYKDATEAVFEQDLITRYKVFNQLETTAIGCTSQAEANRRGRWAILTNNKDRIVSFKVGLDGMIPLPGYIIGVADQYLSGKIMGGRISQADGKTITLDRVPDAKPNDTLIVNLPSGKAEERTIISIAGKVLKVAASYSENPQLESVWCVESSDVNVQQYRVISVKNNDDNTFSISASYHDPDKFLRIDNGAILDSRPISLLPSTVQSVPTNVVISANYSIEQGLSIATLHAQWDKPDGAVYYEVQWRKDLGNWINATKTSTTSFDIQGVYSGIYEVRVCAINAVGVTSQWIKSDATDLKGKDGAPPMPINFKASTNVLFGIALDWNFSEGTGDTSYTEIQYSTNGKPENAMILSNISYPTSTYLQSGLKIGQEFYYRARLVDKIGNISEWTNWIRGVSSSDTSDIAESVAKELEGTKAWQSLVNDQGEIKKLIQEQEYIVNELSLNIGNMQEVASSHEESINANANAIEAIDSRVIETENSITSQSNTINQIESSLNSLDNNIKANSSAIGVLETQTTQQGKDIASASNSITQLNSSLTQARNQGDNVIFDGSFELLTESNERVKPSATSRTGSKSLWFCRDSATGSGNNDWYFGDFISVGDSRRYYYEIWARKDPSETIIPSSIATYRMGLLFMNANNANSWNFAVEIKYGELTTMWKKFSGYITSPSGYVRMKPWFSIVGNSLNAKGMSILLDDLYISDVTDAYAAQKTADASATAVQSLNTKITDQDGKISAQATKITNLSTTVGDVRAEMTDVSNIVNELDGSLSAYRTLKIKVDKNGKQYVAGMSIGIEETEQGMQSNVIFLQDRFSIMNAAGGNPQLIFTTSGNQVIINEAIIGNASITEAKIKDASITSAKIGDSLQSSGFGVDGGWKLSKKDNNLIFTDENNIVRFKIGKIS